MMMIASAALPVAHRPVQTAVTLHAELQAELEIELQERLKLLPVTVPFSTSGLAAVCAATSTPVSPHLDPPRWGPGLLAEK